MTLKPIRTKIEQKSALKRMDGLMGAKPGTEEGDELDILAELVTLYEQRTFPIDPPNPVAAILFRLDQMHLKKGAFGELIGSRSHASEVLNFKRRLSMSIAQKLHKEWRLPADVLLQTYELTER